MRIVGRLKGRQVATIKPPKERRSVVVADGGNLFLQATIGRAGNIRRSWVFRYELVGQRHEIGLGPLHTVSLQTARAKARDLRQQLLDHVDPLTERRKARQTLLAEAAKTVTLKECAEMYLKAHADGWRSQDHRRQWQASLQAHVYPKAGNLAVADIDTATVVQIIEPIWKTIPETANRVRGRIEMVLDFAAVRGFRHGDNPARWKGHMSELFPARSKLAPVESFAAIPYDDMPAFMADLRRHDTIVAKALEILVLTASRTSQVTGAVWGEINLTTRVWTIPPERMKRSREHSIPLSDRAVSILAGLEQLGSRVFQIGPDAMRRLLVTLRPGYTVHGLRSTLYDWATERTETPDIVVKMVLAHAISDRTEKAYRRGNLFLKRRLLMQQWEEFLGRQKTVGEPVTPLRRVDAHA
jgi:integrase